MKAGKTREKFQDQIKKAIYLLDNNVIQEEIIEEMVKRGYTRGHISDILEGNALLETLSLIDLGVLAETIYKIADITSVRLDIFLEDAEIEQVRKYKIRQEQEEDKDLLVFEDVRQVASDIWTMVIPCQKIAQLYRENAVGYDFETQREAKRIKSKDTIIRVANVNWTAVEEIKDLLVKGLFIPNTITFNIPIENIEDVKYDKNKKRLVILKRVLKILDGFHRSLGIIAALREAEINYNFEVRITCFNTDKARQFIVQEDKRNPINKEYIRSIDTADKITNIINNINQNNKSELKGLIATDNSLIRTGNAVVNFSTLYSIIDKLWQPKTFVEANKVSDYLIEFFNEIVGLYPNEFKLHIKESRKLNHINREQMFVIYLVLAKNLENDLNWKQEVSKVMANINIKNDTINNIINTQPSELKNNIKKYIDMSNSMIEEVLKNGRKAI